MSFSKVNGPGWGTGDELTYAQINSLDADHANSVDKTASGDTISGTLTLGSGGSIACSQTTSAILLTGGAKVTANGATSKIQATTSGASIEANVSGALIQATASGALIQTKTGGRISLGDSDYPLIPSGHTGRSRSVIAPLVPSPPWAYSGIAQSISPQSFIGTPVVATLAQMVKGAEVGFVTGVADVANNSSTVYLCPITDCLHNGATLSTAVLNFTVATHVALPQQYPAFGIYRIAATGADFSGSMPSTNCLKSTTAGRTTIATPANVGLYTGAVYALTWTADQNNIIDKSAYAYVLIIWDESSNVAGAVAGNKFSTVTLNHTLITDMAPH